MKYTRTVLVAVSRGRFTSKNPLYEASIKRPSFLIGRTVDLQVLFSSVPLILLREKHFYLIFIKYAFILCNDFATMQFK